MLPEARAAVDAYLLCSTQWAVAPMGGRTGLRYGDCIGTLTLYREQLGVDDVTAVFAHVQTIEHALLTAWAEQREAEQQARG